MNGRPIYTDQATLDDLLGMLAWNMVFCCGDVDEDALARRARELIAMGARLLPKEKRCG